MDRERRQTWAINPVSRKSESPKAYNRKKAQRLPDDGGAGLFLVSVSKMKYNKKGGGTYADGS